MPNKKDAKTAPNKLKYALAKQQALELRQAGWSLTKIATQIGRSLSVTHKYIAETMNELHEKTMEDADKIRQLEIMRLDRMFAGAYPNAIKGDTKAIEKCIKIMERRAKMLGLDAPTKFAHTDPTGEEERDPTSYIVPVPAQIGLDAWIQKFSQQPTSDSPSE